MPDTHNGLQATTPLSTDAGRLARKLEIVDDLTERLRRVCGQLPDAEFHRLVSQIAEITVKYEAADEHRSAYTSAPPGTQ